MGINSRTKKIILISTALVAIGAAAFIIIQKNSANKDSKAQKKSAKSETKQESSYSIATQAAINRDTNRCKAIPSIKEQESCITSIAVSSSDPDKCKEIGDEAGRKNCEEYFAFQKIINGNDINGCLKLLSEDYKNQCMEELFYQIEDISKCKGLGSDNDQKCKDILGSKIAYDKGSEDACAQIKDENLRKNCEKNVENKPKDSDNDGFTDAEERSYGTDPDKKDSDGDGLDDYKEFSDYHTSPLNPDTDGDGFKDGEEVKSGFNPAGPGKIK